MSENPDNDNLLSSIDYPEDLRKLSADRLPEVCAELRHEIIKEVSCNPAHFAASLGTVELVVALHYVFNTPRDRIVWDVGHQAYGHKILTGRRDVFCTNRKLGGIRPFPSPYESEYDTFACGHASNSISAALGMAVAAQLKQETDRRVVAVIGDGSMSGGLAFEGLNNASSMPNDLLIILNDNNMSIDKSVGGMRQYLANLHTTTGYNQLRYNLSQALSRIGLLDDERKKSLIRLGNSLKSAMACQQNIFDGFNIRYFGPVDGHDVMGLVRVLRDIKDMKGPRLLHLHTTKGKGFEPAEKDPSSWHAAAAKFDPETGRYLTAKAGEELPPKYQDVFGSTIVELAAANPNIVCITPAMAQGSGLGKMKETYPERTFDVGIAEGHAMTFSGGLAKEGMQPFCCIYSSFMQRAYDNIIHDVALLRLPVVLCVDRAGLVGEDGPTHHGTFDMAFLRPIPNLTIASPLDERELRRLLYTAQLPGKGPFVIRYPRGRGEHTDWQCPLEEVPVGKGRCLKDGQDMAVITIGPIGNVAARAIATAEHDTGRSIAHYDLRFLKPLDTALLHSIGSKFSRIITVEDGVRNGGMGSAVTEYLSDSGSTAHVTRLGLPDDRFVEHGAADELYHICGLDAEGICRSIKEELES